MCIRDRSQEGAQRGLTPTLTFHEVSERPARETLHLEALLLDANCPGASLLTDHEYDHGRSRCRERVDRRAGTRPLPVPVR